MHLFIFSTTWIYLIESDNDISCSAPILSSVSPHIIWTSVRIVYLWAETMYDETLIRDLHSMYIYRLQRKYIYTYTAK